MKLQLTILATVAMVAACLFGVSLAVGAPTNNGYPMVLPKQVSAHSQEVPASTKYGDVVTSASQWNVVSGVATLANATTVTAALQVKAGTPLNVGTGVGGGQLGLTVSKSYEDGSGTSHTLHFTNGVLTFTQ